MHIPEAVVLGLVSGPACIASCGPVIVPSLLCEQPGVRVNSRYLGSFLGMRLLGYLLFASAVAQLGRLSALSTHTQLFGVVYLLLAIALLLYAHRAGRHCVPSECSGSKLVTIGITPHHRVAGAALLGLLTGINVCPPFIIAAVRAAQLGSFAGALMFFASFFLGTSLWFLPFMAVAYIRRTEAILTVARMTMVIITVARMTMVIIALYYGTAGAAMLFGRRLYGN